MSICMKQLNFDLSDRPGYMIRLWSSGVWNCRAALLRGNLGFWAAYYKFWNLLPSSHERTNSADRTDGLRHQAMQATKPSATERPGSETSRLVIESTCVVCLQPCEGKKACACSFMHQQCAEAYKQTVRHMPLHAS